LQHQIIIKMFAPVFAVLLAFIASASAGSFTYNNCFGETFNHFSCKNNFNVPGMSSSSTVDQCSYECNSRGYTKFSFTPGYGNCLCATDACAAADRTANPGQDSYCVGNGYSKCADGRQCGSNSAVVNVVGPTVEKCAIKCSAYKFFTYVTHTGADGNCLCSNACSPYNTVAAESAVWRLNSGVCPSATLRG
jgi:hypothetical protein